MFTTTQSVHLNMSVSEEESQLALEYWSKVPPTLDGVLGGFGYISQLDIEASQLFLDILKTQHKVECERALDCGAGIGRVTKHLLSENFEKVDLVESDQKFMTAVKDFLGNKLHKVDCMYNCRLQDFSPDKTYNVIWNQWVLGHLNDEDLVSFLKRCKSVLSHNGVIVIKENVTSSGLLEKDDTDQSITRSLKHFLQIFNKSKLKRIKQCRQTNLPDGIYPVYMFALVPDDPHNDT